VAFIQLDQYASSPGCRAYCCTELAIRSSLAVTAADISSDCAYPQRDGLAELACVAGYIAQWFMCPKAVTHPITNWI